MSFWSPDPWLQEPPDGHRPLSVQVNTFFPRDVNQADQTALMNVSQALISHSQGAISRFLANARQNHAIAGRDLSMQFTALPGDAAALDGKPRRREAGDRCLSS